MRNILLPWILFCIHACVAQEYTFPEDFQFGVATASYQIEGAWNVSGKGENIWDKITHERSQFISDGSNGDVACDAYHKVKEDVQLLKNLGVDNYRFSISWSRILPTGFTDTVNPDGIRYYNELIDELLENGIEPLATMYHWDLPQPLQDIGGWPNPLLAQYFEDYSKVLYEAFGDRVKKWITFNEPYQICEEGYSLAEKAPAYTSEGIGGYLCAHTLLLAHAKAYRLYDENYREKQGGQVGITIHAAWYEPDSDSEEDNEAAETTIQMNFGWYANPIFSENGDYPIVMRERIDKISIEEGFPRSRLPSFTSEEISLLKGSADFLGLNHYTTSLCHAATEDFSHPSHMADIGSTCYADSDWESAASEWLKVVPWGLRSVLKWIKNEYNNPEVIITENGFSDSTGELNDCRRVYYYNSYLEELLKAIYEDGCNVTGYMAWSLMDNFEWFEGYTERFGLYRVDFTDPERTRTPKMSSYVYKNILSSRNIDWDYTPEGFSTCEW